MKIAASDIHSAVHRFLLESGLHRTLKAFNKETSLGEEGEEASVGKSKKAKALAELELTEACQLWLDARRNSQQNGAAPPEDAATEAPLPKSKRKKQAAAEETPAAADEDAAAEEPPEVATPAGKRRKDEEKLAEAPIADVACEQQQRVDSTEASEGQSNKKRKKQKEDKPAGVPFKRIDDEKWSATIKDSRLKDNTHEAKVKFGGGEGDSWGDKASEDLLKVKGKGFRKEMAKKKRASWRGGGEIDQGVNSIKFEDSDEE